MLHCGLLGEKLGHSYSPQIHAELGDYEYLLYEKAPDEVEDFVRNGKWDGLNVTIPYKKTVIPFCDELSETARLIGSVNTLLRRPDGSLFGDNTDAFGFEKLLEAAGFHPEGKKALVLGTGGASATVCAVLRRHGAQVITVSRSGEVNYENLFPRHADAALVVNTTPVGMYPKNGEKPLDLAALTKPEAVLDVVYNPARTALLLQAEELGIPCAGGLRMLVGQGIRASEIFQGISIPATELERILQKLSAQMQNLILIGMPGSGKTSISGRLAERLGRPCVEADAEVERACGRSIPEIFAAEGEEGFRRRETEVLRELGKQSGLVISTGGGCVTRPENYPLLHQNGVLIRLIRDVEKLPREGRPLSLRSDLKEMAARREPMYARFADMTVSNDGSREETVQAILKGLAVNSGAKPPAEEAPENRLKFLVINGPNLNMLGIREPEIYGREDYAALERYIRDCCAREGIEPVLFQSNHEGAIVDCIQQAFGVMDGIVINPAAYTHTSVAILDALKAVAIPAVEVHLSDVSARESFRQVSYAGMACLKTWTGLGFEGYREAIHWLKAYLNREG